MYIGNDICQLLQSCMEEPASVDHVRNPQFPLSEFFYMVLSTGVELRDNFSSLEYLPQLIEQYRNDHPDCTLTVEELVSEGWLTPFMDRWDFNIVPDKADIMSDALTPNDKERVAVLCWLLDQRKELEGVFVLQFRKIRRQFQQNFPTIPDQDWFVRNGYLSKNGQCLSHGHYSSEIAEALAFLWARNVNPDDTEQLDWWLNLAVALGLLRSAFEKLSSDHQKLLLERILLRLEAGTYPDLRAENIRIAMFLGWRQKQYATNNEFITGDLVVDIHSFNRAYWEWGHRLYQRQKVLAFYLSTLCSYVSVLEKPLFTRAARIIRRLATLGCLYGIHIPASALLCLWESPETSLIACERMMFQYMQKSVLPDDLFCTILQKIVEQDVLDRCQSTGDGTEPLSLLRFFAHQPQGGRLGDCAVKALAQLLTALKRGRQRLEYLLDSLVGALALRLEQEREYLSWAYDFRLACLVMQKVYYHGDMLVAGSAHSFQALRGMLLTQYIRIFQPDGVLKEFVPSFLDDVCFFQSFWCDVYREEMSSMLERCQFLQPQLTPPKGEKSQLIHYHKCVIHLTVLTVLMQNRQDPDTILEDAFAQTLVQILRPQNNLLNYDRIAMMEAQPIFEAAIALVRSSEKCYNLFMQELESYELPELILICHGAKDSKLRMRCCHIIENSINGKNDALRVFSIEKLVQIILDERVESLYTMVEHVLEHQLEKWKNRKSYMSRQQQDWAESELNRVWLLKKAYEKVLKEGLPFYQAIVWMESPKHQDLDRAEKIWEYLLEKSLYSSYVINLIHTYILQYKAAQSKEDGIVVCSKIMERALVLRERVENSAYSAWSEADQNAYVRMLYTLYRETEIGRASCRERV